MRNTVLFIAILFLASCNTGSNKKQEPQKEITTAYKLELIWESDTTVRTPESVLLDRERDVLYVSCINEGPWVEDGNGFISKMDKSGNVIELKWIEGISAPKGMGISGNSLFIADLNTLVEASIETGEIVNKIEFDEKVDLNDITVAPDGTVFVSGSASNTIYKLVDGELKPIHTGDEGERFNGLFWKEDRMLLLTSASSEFREILWETMEAKVISKDMGHGDAIVAVGDGGYITTSWAGAVFYVSVDGEVTELLNTEANGENAADADFCIEEQILYLPTFFKNQVKAYKLTKE